MIIINTVTITDSIVLFVIICPTNILFLSPYAEATFCCNTTLSPESTSVSHTRILPVANHAPYSGIEIYFRYIGTSII